MAARQLSGKKPKHLRYTLGTLLSYMGRHKLLLLIVAILVTISALANLLGTYMIRPIVNNLVSGDVHTLILGVAVTAGIYADNPRAPHPRPEMCPCSGYTTGATSPPG